MRMEFSELQHELRSFQTERDELYKKTMLQQTLLEEVLGEKERLEQDLGWLSSRNACDVSEGKYSFKEEPSESGAGKVRMQAKYSGTATLGAKESGQRRCDMRHKLLTQHALFILESMQKKSTLSQHFVARVVRTSSGKWLH